MLTARHKQNPPNEIALMRHSCRVYKKKAFISHYEKVVCSEYDLAVTLLHTKTRERHVVEARQLIMYLAIDSMRMTQTKAGSYFGLDHATARHAKNAITNLLDTDPNFKNIFNRIEKKL